MLKTPHVQTCLKSACDHVNNPEEYQVVRWDQNRHFFVNTQFVMFGRRRMLSWIPRTPYALWSMGVEISCFETVFLQKRYYWSMLRKKWMGPFIMRFQAKKTSAWKNRSKKQLQCVQIWWRPTGNIWSRSLLTNLFVFFFFLQSIELNFCCWPNTYYTQELKKKKSLKIIQWDFLVFFSHSVSYSCVPMIEITDLFNIIILIGGWLNIFLP